MYGTYGICCFRNYTRIVTDDGTDVVVTEYKPLGWMKLGDPDVRLSNGRGSTLSVFLFMFDSFRFLFLLS